MGRTPVDQAIEIEDRITGNLTFDADSAFRNALRQAIAKGREKAREGVFVDASPFLPRRYVGEAQFSGCGSPGAMCAETDHRNGARGHIVE